MKMIAKIALGCLAALAIAGCAATWQHASAARRAEAPEHGITVGKTTKTELDTALGQATAISLDSGYDVWVYKNKEEDAGLARYLPLIGRTALFGPAHRREVIVLFRPDGVVKKYRVHRYRG
ncbi:MULTISPECIES: hypothetical protein [unclassified Janthinobacterium]|uniref:hypothetical protein n=1 Tax=unclassified Janthinobacterium TaxID=2610881 RepID=UPI0003496C58|nr:MULTISPECIES: hypothetical protein [unclassified Janthinobacterium]MEC5162016.1 hypothetical protein [Janthinobacterium sp. CG_S6]